MARHSCGENCWPIGGTEHGAVHSRMTDQVEFADDPAGQGQPGQLGFEVALVVQAGDDHLGVGACGGKLATHGGRGHRELGRAAPVVGGVSDPNHRLSLASGCDVGEGDPRVAARRDPCAVVADELEHFCAVQVEDPHPGRRRAIQVQGEAVGFGGHVVDVGRRDRDRDALIPADLFGDGELRSPPTESTFVESSRQGHHEAP